jgi:hypothetical protein
VYDRIRCPIQIFSHIDADLARLSTDEVLETASLRHNQYVGYVENAVNQFRKPGKGRVTIMSTEEGIIPWKKLATLFLISLVFKSV